MTHVDERAGTTRQASGRPIDRSQAERATGPGSRPLTPGLRVVRFAVGYLHLLTAILR